MINKIKIIKSVKNLVNKLSFKRCWRWLLPASIIFFVVGVVYLDIQVTQRFEGRIWQLPARVYARPLELYAGKQISAQQLLHELRVLNYAKLDATPQQPGQYSQAGQQFEIISRDFEFWDGYERSRSIRLDISNDIISSLENLYTGEGLSIIRLDPAYLTGIFPSHNEDRILLKIDDVPGKFLEMLILVEDRRFYDHLGVDPISIARALVANIKAGHTVQGGSTITQQLVKNLYLNSKQNLWRKAVEAVMALLLEFHYDKQQILETYLNEIFLGQDNERAIHGFGLASRHYFGKPLEQLSLDQMAVLVGMVKGASYYNPRRSPERVMERRNVVLSTMLENELVSPQQHEKLAARKLHVLSRAKRGRYPAFVDLVKRQLQAGYEAEDLRSEGLQIFTTLDPLVQYATEKAITETLPTIDYGSKPVSKQTDVDAGLDSDGEGDNARLQAAAIVVSPDNGDVLAVVGDREPGANGFNRALDARRQIGSLIKPVIYLAALKNHDRYSWATVLDDTRLRVEGEDKKIWEPQNYDKEYHGNVIAYDALLNSYNIPAARLGLELGLDNIVQTLRELGSQRNLPPYPSITLGAIDMAPFEVAAIYQSFAANGFHSPLRSVVAVLDSSGTALTRYAIDVERQIDEQSIALINYALQKVTEAGTARRLSNELSIKVAGKTGTSDDLRDSWFAGFSGDMVAVVWAGYDDNRPAGLTGSSGAMRVWSKIMKNASAKSYLPVFTDNIEMRWIDKNSGLLAAQECENAVELPFIRGSAPESYSECVKSSPFDWISDIFD